MKIEFEKENKLKSAPLRYVIYAIVVLFLSLIHLILLGFISIGGITPDLILILCVWVALKEGQFVGIFAGFGAGILFDLVTYDVLGTNALAKTVVAFIAGYFYRENMSDAIIRSYKFILIVLLCSFVHNLIYFFFYLKPSDITYFPFFMKNGVASAFYTTVFAIFVMLGRIPSRRIKSAV